MARSRTAERSEAGSARTRRSALHTATADGWRCAPLVGANVSYWAGQAGLVLADAVAFALADSEAGLPREL